MDRQYEWDLLEHRHQEYNLAFDLITSLLIKDGTKQPT